MLVLRLLLIPSQLLRTLSSVPDSACSTKHVGLVAWKLIISPLVILFFTCMTLTLSHIYSTMAV